MTNKKRADDGLALNMPFGEALERFIGVDPREMHANVARAKKKKPPGGKKPKPGGKVSAKNVVSLRERKTRLRSRGHA